jgi:purine nucleosidase
MTVERSIPMIVDCDTGIDDALALLYAAHHGADLRACTVTHGNVPVDVGARNTMTVLELAGRREVPVFTGASRPMAQPLDASHAVHGLDGLGDTGWPMSTRTPAGDLAAVEIVGLARAHPGELTVVAIGPLTNLGLALLLEPSLPSLVSRVVVMGGAVGAPGNVTPVAEANVWHDPEAAQLVVDAPWDVTFVGLELTMRHPIPLEVLDRIEKSHDPRSTFAWTVMQHYIDFYEKNRLGYRSCVPHDALAMAIALDPELASRRALSASVETAAGDARGAVIADLREPVATIDDPTAPGVITIVDEIDIDTFHERLLVSLGA